MNTSNGCTTSQQFQRLIDACDLVAFDMDGTLLASHEFAPAAAQQAFTDLTRELGRHDPPPSLELIRAQIGKPWHSFYSALLPADLLDRAADLHDRIAHLENIALRGGRARLFDGIDRLLADLVATGRRVAIISNASTGYFETVLDVFHLRRVTHFTTCLGERGWYPKHLMLADALAATATRRACMVGDTAADFLAATWHGFPSVGMRYGYGKPSDFTKATVQAERAADVAAWFVPRRYVAP